jgi:hypothetical protein
MESVLFEGVGAVQALTVEELYQGILQHLKHVCVPSEYTDCILETKIAKDSIKQIKKNWLELQRRNLITFPIHYGTPGHTRVAEYPDYLSDELECVECLSPIPLNAPFFIHSETYMKIGTQECALCTKHNTNQIMNRSIQFNICRLLLNTIRIVGIIVEDRLSKLQRLKRELSLLYV